MAFVITVIADTSFVQGLITAVASAAVSGTFLIASVRMTNKVTDKKAQEVKKQVLQGQEDVKDAVIKKVEENS
jgi:uncharacterized membrane-anchored protein